MKKLSTYLFLLLFSFPTPSQADDIRDFQIEGVSIGDSLLDYMSEEEIKENNVVHVYPDKKFTVSVCPALSRTFFEIASLSSSCFSTVLQISYTLVE